MSLSWFQAAVPAADQSTLDAATARQEQLTKPRGSLGRLETLAVTLAGLQRREKPQLEHVAITVFAADHGVAAEGVSAFPQEVTAAMIANFAHGGAAISVLANEIGARLEVANVGALSASGGLPGVVDCRVAPGTANFCKGPAMTDEELHQALAAGRDAVERAAAEGCELFIGGEMGIANTSAATAIAAALLHKSPAELAGPGTGLDAQGVSRKAEVIGKALMLHDGDLSGPLEVLRLVGGFEIAALSGAYIAAAQRGIAVLVDGFIATSAALAALRINPAIEPWLFLSHASAEPGHAAMVTAIGKQPLIDLGMRLGEGSGAATCVPLLRLACALHNNMATFAEAGVAEGN